MMLKPLRLLPPLPPILQLPGAERLLKVLREYLSFLEVWQGAVEVAEVKVIHKQVSPLKTPSSIEKKEEEKNRWLLVKEE